MHVTVSASCNNGDGVKCYRLCKRLIVPFAFYNLQVIQLIMFHTLTCENVVKLQYVDTRQYICGMWLYFGHIKLWNIMFHFSAP